MHAMLPCPALPVQGSGSLRRGSPLPCSYQSAQPPPVGHVMSRVQTPHLSTPSPSVSAHRTQARGEGEGKTTGKKENHPSPQTEQASLRRAGSEPTDLDVTLVPALCRLMWPGEKRDNP
jgi:hypothetical protein